MRLPSLSSAASLLSRKWAHAVAFVGFNALALATAYLLCQPIRYLFSDRSEQLSRESEALAHYDDFLVRAGSIVNLDRTRRTRGHEQGEYFEAADDGAFGAQLQSILKQTIESSGARLYSARALPLKTANDVRFNGVHVEFAGSILGVASATRAIETSKPYLFIDEASFSSANPTSMLVDTTEPDVQAQLDVYAAVDPDGPHD